MFSLWKTTTNLQMFLIENKKKKIRKELKQLINQIIEKKQHYTILWDYLEMCITFFFINREPNASIKFAMVHNREEDFARPTAPLGQFKEDTNIFGGRDLRE